MPPRLSERLSWKFDRLSLRKTVQTHTPCISRGVIGVIELGRALRDVRVLASTESDNPIR